MRKLLLAACALLFVLTACTPAEPPSPEIAPLEKSLASAQKRLVELEGEIKTAGDDTAATAPLTEEKKLVESRILRTKEKLKSLGALPAEPAAGGGGGH